MLRPILLASLFLCAAANAQSTPEDVTATVLEGYRTSKYELSVSVIDPAELKTVAGDVRAVFGDRSTSETNPMRAVLFGDGMSNKELLESSDSSLMAQFLDGYMKVLSQRSGAAPVQVTAYTVLGHINEGPDLAHVLARVTVQDKAFSVTAIRPFTVKKVADQWKAQLDETAKAMIAKLRKELEP